MAAEISRRELLQIAATASAAAAMPIRLNQDPPKPVGWAILGLGGYATRQIMPSFSDAKLSKLVAVITGTPEKGVRAREQYGLKDSAVYGYDQWEAIRANPEIEVVYVITPPGTHRDFTLAAIKAGKHVCCEKPMANTVAECDEMIAAAKRANRLLQIGYRSHYQTHNLAAIEACRRTLGTLRSITSEHGFNMPAGTWRTQRKLSGGGALWDIGIYGVQAARYLAGEEPTEVMAMAHRLAQPRFDEVDDVTHMMLAFPSGVVASVSTGYSWAGANAYRVIGDRGQLYASPATSYQGHRLWINNRDVPLEPNNHFAAQMDHLSDVIRNGGTLRTPGEMGRQDIRILEAAVTAARQRGPVRLGKPA
ncbi:MAG: Gfo/Idh/MocA family oxidoreductase [Fimbriimonadaceae bacterium]|nr:Gfo/Idh/MocA family oxidoreductase [Fimbriimonadaceae bacterium]